MTILTLASGRRGAEDFAALLDERGFVRTLPAQRRAELEPLAALARGLAPGQHVATADFRAALRERLLTEAAARVPAPVVPAKRPAPSQGHPRLRQAVAGLALATVVTGVGSAVASTQALPGDSLYGLKRQIEGVQLALARGDVARGRELLEQADARLSEAEQLMAGAAGADPSTRALVTMALADMDAAVALGADDLTRAYRDTGDEEPMLVLKQFVTEQRERLDDLMLLLDPTRRDQASAIADRLAVLDRSVTVVLAGSPAGLALTTGALTSSERAVGTRDEAQGGAAAAAKAGAAGRTATTGGASDQAGQAGAPTSPDAATPAGGTGTLAGLTTGSTATTAAPAPAGTLSVPSGPSVDAASVTPVAPIAESVPPRLPVPTIPVTASAPSTTSLPSHVDPAVDVVDEVAPPLEGPTP